MIGVLGIVYGLVYIGYMELIRCIDYVMNDGKCIGEYEIIVCKVKLFGGVGY